MTSYRFSQVDVFAAGALNGNPLAVAIGADDMSDGQMARFANWTNLSETTFLLRPANQEADYRVRIFTPSRELPFAGHPTLGSCHVWLGAGGMPRGEFVVQECGAGLVRIRRDGGRLAFAAPALLRDGPLDEDVLDRATRGLGLTPRDVLASSWIDNGPGWLGLLLHSRAAVLAVRPDYVALGELRVGIVGPCEAGSETAFELRAFTSSYEDPVTGSLNASVAQWLIGDGIAPATYVAAQGTALGRSGRIHVTREGGEIWIGGNVTTRIEGTLRLD